MIKALKQTGTVLLRWVNADEHYGMNPDLLDAVAEMEKWYFAEVPVNTRVWPEKVKILDVGKGQTGNLKTGRPRSGPRVARNQPAAQEVRQLAAELPAGGWRR